MKSGETVMAIDPGVNKSAVVSLIKTADGFRLESAVLVRNDWKRKGKRKEKTTDPGQLYGMASKVFLETIKSPQPITVAVEEPFTGKNATTARWQHGVFAGIVYALTAAGWHVTPVWPPTVKSFVGASKKQFVIREVYRKWGYAADDDNLVDAFAIAMWMADRLEQADGGPPGKP